MARKTKTEQKLGLFQEKVSLIFSSQICWPLQINLAKAIFPQSLDYESKLRPKFKHPAFLPHPLPPTDWVADVSNCVINAMAGLISEILLSNYIQTFISQAESVMVAQQVGPAGRRPLVVEKLLLCRSLLACVCVCVWICWQDGFLYSTDNYPSPLSVRWLITVQVCWRPFFNSLSLSLPCMTVGGNIPLYTICLVLYLIIHRCVNS